MVKQYPYTIECTVPGDSTIVGGLVVPGTSSSVSYPCRYRPNTGAKSVKTADGQTVVYRGTCYLKPGPTLIKMGDVVSVPGFITDTVVLQVHGAQMRRRIIL